MTVDTATIERAPAQFDTQQQTLARWRGFEATTFLYPSGVAGLRLRNAVGHMDLLPFHGQQIWDAHFHGRQLTMRSMFDAPVATRDYLGNYGGFFLHCGATAMGNPGPDDTHPLHGELPNSPYDRAALILGSDEHGAFMGLEGSYRHTIAFSANYTMTPHLRLHEDSGRIELNVTIRNLKRSPMELMYLAHINFRPADGARLVDTIRNDDISLRTTLPSVFAPNPAHAALIEELSDDIDAHRHVQPGRAIDPELVMGISAQADSNGWAHAMQVHPDGHADLVSHRPGELPLGVRWMTRTADQDALGLVLPATAGADGYAAEKAKGNVVEVPAGEAFVCHLRFGALRPDEAETLKRSIDGMTAR